MPGARAGAATWVSVASREEHPAEDHLRVLDRSLGFYVSREHVVVDRLCVDGIDTGFAVVFDRDYNDHLQVTSVASAADAAAVVNHVVRYIRRRLKDVGVVSLHMVVSCSSVSILAEAVRGRMCCVEAAGRDSFTVFRTHRLSREASVECAVTVGWTGGAGRRPGDRPVSMAPRGCDPPVLPGDEYVESIDKVMFDSQGYGYSVSAITVSRRRACIRRDSPGRVCMRFDRPIVMFSPSHDMTCDDIPFRISTRDTPRIAANRLNKVPGARRGVYVALQKCFVAAIWEIGSVRPELEVRPAKDIYGVLDFYRDIGRIGVLCEHNRAVKIQRWWRRIMCNPLHRVGDGYLRRCFARFAP
jgi:hypothetical protein